jgi:uncharacterized protein with GYD domain
MAHYLFQVAYTPLGTAALVNNPQDRADAVRAPIEKLGGKVENFWFSFGDYDVVGIIEMPDNVSAAAFAMAVSAGGACKAVKTTPLLSTQEGLAAMRKAAACGYRAATTAV